ncbi:MAG: cobalamin biosynthesis protein P47K [Oscillospiraceae bacterium]|nr:cobalamin biosynthesis protein P47K [Oscillospiraceae bacterium]
MNILLLSGFLGSGKTSVLLQLAKHIADTVPGDGMKVMIIENEIGEVGVDDKILRAQGLAVKDLFAGCACCTSGGDLLNDIAVIRDSMDPAWIIVEATGVAYPKQIKESVEQCLNLPVRILALADASRWKRLKNYMSHLLEAQIECAELAIVNKVDLVDEETVKKIAEDIRGFNPTATIDFTVGNKPIDPAVWQPILG